MSDISSPETTSLATPKPEKLNLTTKLAYGAGDMGPSITANISVFYLLFFLTDVAGLPAGLAGSVLMIGKIADAINDPFIGILSDRTRTRWGRRLPWMLFGTIPFGLFFFLQWLVPHFSDNGAVNQWFLFGYYVLIGILLNLTYTTVNLPYQALTPELTQDYNERTSLNSFRFAFSLGSSVLALVLAQLIFSAYPSESGKKYLILGCACALLSVVSLLGCILGIQERGAKPILINRQKRSLGAILLLAGIAGGFYGINQILSWTPTSIESQGKAGAIGILAILLSLLIFLFGITLLLATPELHLIDDDAVRERSQANCAPSIPFLEQLRIVLSNQPFLYVVGIYLCSWLGAQLTASILIYFVVSWMRLPEGTFPQVAIAVQGTALAMLFFWKAVSDRAGKKVTYFLGTSLWIAAQAGLFLLQPGQVGLMYALAILAGCGVSVAYLIPWSMVPDVIELDQLKTGQRREGIFYAFMVLLQKFGLALGLFLVGIALQAAGFVERMAGEPIPVQPESALLAIRIAIGPFPTVVLIVGSILAYCYPITREVHAEIRLQLEERNRGDIIDL